MVTLSDGHGADVSRPLPLKSRQMQRLDALLKLFQARRLESPTTTQTRAVLEANSVTWTFSKAALTPQKPTPPVDALVPCLPGYRCAPHWAERPRIPRCGGGITDRSCEPDPPLYKVTVSHSRPPTRAPYSPVTFSPCQSVSEQILNIGLGIRIEYIHTFLENLQTNYSTFVFAL